MNSRGFTLIEIIVSLAIFSIVAVIAVGALVRVVGANRQAQSIQSSVNNISFALESMSRELRTGTTYDCISGLTLGTWNGSGPLPTHPCSIISSGNAVLAFTSSNVSNTGTGAPCNLVYAYRFLQSNGGAVTVEKAEQSSCGQAISDSQFYPIISPGVTMTGYRLAVFYNSSNPPSGQPYAWAFIRLTGYAGVRVQDQNSFDIQTSVSERTRG